MRSSPSHALGREAFSEHEGYAVAMEHLMAGLAERCHAPFTKLSTAGAIGGANAVPGASVSKVANEGSGCAKVGADILPLPAKHCH